MKKNRKNGLKKDASTKDLQAESQPISVVHIDPVTKTCVDVKVKAEDLPEGFMEGLTVSAVDFNIAGPENLCRVCMYHDDRYRYQGYKHGTIINGFSDQAARDYGHATPEPVMGRIVLCGFDPNVGYEISCPLNAAQVLQHLEWYEGPAFPVRGNFGVPGYSMTYFSEDLDTEATLYATVSSAEDFLLTEPSTPQFESPKKHIYLVVPQESGLHVEVFYLHSQALAAARDFAENECDFVVIDAFG